MDIEKLKRYVELKNQVSELNKELKEIEANHLKGKIQETVFIPEMKYKITYTPPKDKKEVNKSLLYSSLQEKGQEELYVKYSNISLTDFEKMTENEDIVFDNIDTSELIKVERRAISESFRATKMNKKELKEKSDE
jgi:hypothetical protein